MLKHAIADPTPRLFISPHVIRPAPTGLRDLLKSRPTQSSVLVKVTIHAMRSLALVRMQVVGRKGTVLERG